MTHNEVYAYTAGLLDGEGSFLIARSPTFFAARVTIVMTDRRPIDWLQEHFPGNNHSNTARNPDHAEQYLWGISNKVQLAKFIPLVLPYLQVKKIQAELVWQFCRQFPLKRKCKMTDEDRRIGEMYYKIGALLNSKGAGSQELKARIVTAITGGQGA